MSGCKSGSKNGSKSGSKSGCKSGSKNGSKSGSKSGCKSGSSLCPPDLKAMLPRPYVVRRATHTSLSMPRVVCLIILFLQK